MRWRRTVILVAYCASFALAGGCDCAHWSFGIYSGSVRVARESAPPIIPFGGVIEPAGSMSLRKALIPERVRNGSTVPLWPIVVAGVLFVRKEKSNSPHACTRCGYDVRGCVSGRCSECGVLYSARVIGGERLSKASRPRIQHIAVILIAYTLITPLEVECNVLRWPFGVYHGSLWVGLSQWYWILPNACTWEWTREFDLAQAVLFGYRGGSLRVPLWPCVAIGILYLAQVKRTR